MLFKFDITKYFTNKDANSEDINGLSENEFQERINKVNDRFRNNIISEAEMGKHALSHDKFVYKVEYAQTGLTLIGDKSRTYTYTGKCCYLADEDIIRILRGEI